MTIKEYQRKAMRTATPKCYNTANAALGLTGEAGEVADEVKKCMYQGHPWQPSKIIEELGDVLWYVTLMAELMNVPLEYIVQANIEKLERRYPDGFFAGGERESGGAQWQNINSADRACALVRYSIQAAGSSGQTR